MKSLRFSRTSRTGTWLMATVSLLAIGSAFAQRDRITHVLDNYRTVVVPGHLNPLAKAKFDQGAVDPGFALPGMTLTVRRTAAQQSSLNQLLAAQQNPASPQYHKWLTPEAFARRFGASPNDLATLRQWLESEGFQIRAVARGGTFIRFDARASQVQNAFKTEIHQYTVRGVKHYANASEPSVPANLAPLVLAVGGMDDFGPQPNHVELASGSGAPSAHYLANSKNNLAPGDLTTIYNMGTLQTDGASGAGQTVVVLGASDVTLTDLAGYRTSFTLGSAAIPLQVIHPDLAPGTGTLALATEATMQLELVSAVAPQAALILDADSNVWNALADAVDNARGQVISMSFGTCETGADGSSASAIQSTMQAANAEGITVIAASGDAGGAGCDVGVIADGATLGATPTLPASIPEVTGVGGTEFNEGGSTYWATTGSHTATGYIPEVVWNDTPTLVASQTFAASGGGVSTLFALPTWQTVATGLLANVVDTGRNVPDVALAASATHDGYVIYMNGRLSTAAGTPYTVGGTTAPASVFAGILALLNETQGSGTGAGNINPILYSLATADFGVNAVFHVATGNNEIMCAAGQSSPSCASGYWGFAAGTDGTTYNQAIGLGSVDASALETAWDSYDTPPTITSVTPSTATAGTSLPSSGLVTIAGTGFTGSTAVYWTFNGVSTLLEPTVGSDTSLTVTVSSTRLLSAGTAYLRVVSTNGLYSAPAPFTIQGAIVSQLSPSYATLGNTAGFTLTVNGSGFSPQAAISFGGTTIATTDVSSTSLTASYCASGCPITPTMINSIGSKLVKVISNGATSTAVGFAVNAKPTIANTSDVINNNFYQPAEASMGGADTVVTLTGTGFTSDSTVTWQPPSSGSTYQISPTFVSATSLTAVVPSLFLTASGTAHIQVVSGDGVSSSTSPFAFVIGLTPTITYLSPSHTTASRSTALTLTVHGTGFSSGAAISFNGTALTTDSSGAPTLLTASIPSASLSAGTPAVLVTNSDSIVSSPIDLTVNAAPAISTINGSAAATANVGIGYTTLAIVGTNFASGSSVTWTPTGGLSGAGVPVALSSVWTSATAMTATVPSTLLTAAGTANVKVVGPTPDFSTSAAYSFGIVAVPPTVTGLNPAVATVGNPGLPVTITGTGFKSSSTVACIDSLSASHALTSLLYSTASSLIATMPTACLAAGAYTVQVTTGGVASIASVATPPLDRFTVNPAPAITSITPSSATAGSTSAVTLTIAGTNITATSTVTWVGTNNANPYTLGSPSCAVGPPMKCLATVPASYLATARLATVNVKTHDGVSSSATNNFSIASANITGFNPGYAMVGGSAFALTVSGTGFQAGATVKVWNGTSFASVTTSFVSATQLTANITTIPGTAGPMPIEVVNGVDGTTSVASNFPIIDAIAPTISSVSPSSIVVGAPATAITIKGVNFVAGTGAGAKFVAGSLVNLGATALTVTAGTATSITATLPTQTSVGVQNLTVLNGAEASNAIPITVVGPTIKSVSPTAIAVGTNGTSVVVTGTNFVIGTSTGTTVKTFSNNSNVYLNGGGSPLTATAVTATAITATVPAGSLSSTGALSLTVQNPGGATSTAISVPVGAPTITSLSPSSTGAGTVASGSTLTVTVNGTNFVTGGSNASKVYWAGSPLTTVYKSATQLTVAVLGSVLNASPSQIVTVQNGSVASSGTTFNVSGPTISSLSPSSTLVGAASFTLTVTGTHFVASSQVKWGDTALTTVGTPSTTVIKATVGAGLLTPTGLYPITVVNGTTPSTAVNFAVGPTIATLSPALASAGGAPFTLTVTGTNFASTSQVVWDGTSLTTKYVSSTQLTASVGNTQLATAGTPAITVTNGTTPATSPDGTTFAVNGPTVTSLSVTSAISGSSSFPLTVTGTNFVTGTNASVVMWGSTPLATTVNSATQLTATVTSNVLGTTVGSPISVTVVNGSATPASSGTDFTVSGPAITLMSPTSAAAGGASFTLTVAGSNFNSTSVVYWNSTPLTTVGSTTSGQITATVTNALLASAGSQTITVQNGSATATSNTGTFTVNGPTLTGLSAVSAPAGTSSLTLTVYGTNFVTGGTSPSQVYWGATGLTTIWDSPTQLHVALTTQLATTVGSPVTVTVQNGTNVSGSISFTVSDPVITSLGPVSTDPAGTTGFTLTITGTNFVNGVSTVYWNGVALATPNSVSATQITVAVPTGNLALAGTPGVTVQNGSATLASTASTFTITPTVTSLSSTSATAGGSTFTLTVHGVGFVSGAQVFFGATQLSTIYVNSTTLTATVPSTSISSTGTPSVTVQAGGATSAAGITFTITP